jgi:hypothetical protein
MDGQMFKKTIITLVALSVFMAFPALAKNKGNTCKERDVAGPYVRTISGAGFVDGYGVYQERTYFRSLTLGPAGTVHQFDGVGQDVMLNAGARSEWNGAWACQPDGSLVVVVYHAIFQPVPQDTVFPGSVADLYHVLNEKTTYRFTVDSNDMLTLTEAVVRSYDMFEDPQDPSAGSLGPVFPGSATYNRLKATDADLLP